MVRRLVVPFLVMALLSGCGGPPLQTATPAFARFNTHEILQAFKGAGLRVENLQPLAPGALGAQAPRYREAQSFAAGQAGSPTAATLFTFDSPADLTAMETFLREHYGKKGRIVAYQNALLIFSVAGTEDTGAYDRVLLAMR